MKNPVPHDITRVLQQVQAGDADAEKRLVDLAYDELRGLAAALMQGERPDHTLQPTALVHEAGLRLMGQQQLARLENRSHFYGAMAKAMRRVLVDHARRRNRHRREGSRQRVPLDDVVDCVERDHQLNLVALDEALTQLQQVGGRESEVVVLRFFGGLELAEIADQLEVSLSTVKRDWQFARAWLRQAMTAE